jgi:phytoene desaturase
VPHFSEVKKVLVIGSGFSSLSAACYLAKDGYDVTVVEKNDQPGGRARQWKKDGFTFDMGPTWYWMPDIFENFFSDFGKKTSDYYSLERLDPSYRVYFSEKDFMDLPVGVDKIKSLFENLEKGSGKNLEKFLASAKKTYDVTVNEMVHIPGHSPLELVSVDTISNLNLFLMTVRQQVRSLFKHPHIRNVLEFPVLFLGAKPGNIPAFYNFMNYADLELGTWYPSQGMYSVVTAMHDLAVELGVKFKYNCEVQKIDVANGISSGIIAGEKIESDIVVSGADYHHSEQLLDADLRGYSEKYWDKKVFAPSALLFYLGINRKLENMIHHSLFFDAEFDNHAEAIYDNRRWPEKPLFYVSCASKTDLSSAPAGCENVTVLVPVAPGIEDNEETREKYFSKVIDRMEKLTNQKIKEHIILKRSYCISDFEKDYHSYKGNAYGLANTLLQTAFLRPKIRSRKVNNLYFAGQLTVPGPGVPPCIISGKIVAGEISKDYPN